MSTLPHQAAFGFSFHTNRKIRDSGIVKPASVMAVLTAASSSAVRTLESSGKNTAPTMT